MIDRRTFLAGAAAATAAGIAPRAPAAPPGMLSPSAMRGDLAVLDEAYAALHPGLDRYLGGKRWRQRITAARDWASRERPAGDFFLQLARLTAAVRCGHSYPNPVNQADAVRESLLDGRNRLPFAFRWAGSRIVVTRPFGGIALAPGTMIDRIDGVPTAALLAQLLALARADGANDGKRRALMATGDLTRYPAFDVYRPLLLGARGEGSVAVRADGRTVRLAALTEAERQALAGGKPDDGGWRFRIDPDGVAVLTMPDWALYNSKWDWRGFIDRAVDQLIDERARGLVIDLRDNEGGLDCGDVLLERLIERPLAEPHFVRLVRYRRVPDYLAPHLDTWDRSFRDWGEQARPSGRPGYFRLVRGPQDEPGAAIVPRGRRYSGPVAALISPACSSATFQFANLVKGRGRVLLVGETTGGNRRGINGGAYFFVRLPATGMEVDLPLIGYFPEAPQPDRGVEPDIAAPWRPADLTARRDTALAVARTALLAGH